jgi:hypothetical protein
MDPALLAKLVGALLLAWWHASIEREGRRHEALWASLLRPESQKTRVWKKGPVLLPIVIVDDTGAKVNLGTSFETPESMTSSTTLDSEAIIVEVEDGPRLALTRGAKIVVNNVVGADRKLLRVVTTASGAEQEFNFELAPGQKLWLVGELTRDVTDQKGGPFRGYFAGEIAPIDGSYHLSSAPPNKWISGCGYPLAIGGAALAALAALMGSTVGLGIAATLMLLTIGMQKITLPAPPPKSADSASATGVRVEGASEPHDAQQAERASPSESSEESARRAR